MPENSNVIPMLDLFSGIRRPVDLHSQEKSPTLWPTPNTMDSLPPKRGEALLAAKMKGGCCNLREWVDSHPSPTPKSNPSPAPCITGTFPVQSALAESKMLRAIQSLSDAVHSRLSSLAGFLASRTVVPGNDWQAQMIETCGASAAEYLGSYDPATHSLRMSQACLPLSLDGSSTESLATWPRCGMLVCGRLYQLPPLAHPIDGNESGLSAETKEWRTATAFDWKNTDCSTQVYLSDQVEGRTNKQGFSGPPSPATGRADPVKPRTDGNRQELWATPSTAAAVGCAPQDCKGKRDLRLDLKHEGLPSGKLNPHWVLTLMGYPPLWAELGRKFITASRNLRAQATPSCPKSPPSSSTQSGDN